MYTRGAINLNKQYNLVKCCIINNRIITLIFENINDQIGNLQDKTYEMNFLREVLTPKQKFQAK